VWPDLYKLFVCKGLLRLVRTTSLSGRCAGELQSFQHARYRSI